MPQFLRFLPSAQKEFNFIPFNVADVCGKPTICQVRYTKIFKKTELLTLKISLSKRGEMYINQKITTLYGRYNRNNADNYGDN